MANDLQNIDNFFKDALSNYSEEQPSRAAWKRISGKLFIYDLLHLNLLNIPYFVPAVTTIVAGIIAVLVFTSGPDINTQITPVKDNNNTAVITKAETVESSSVKDANEITRDVTDAPNKETAISQSGSELEKTIGEDHLAADAMNISKVNPERSKPADLKIRETLPIGISEKEMEKEEEIPATPSVIYKNAFNPVILSEKSKLIDAAEKMMKPIAYNYISGLKTANIYRIDLLPIPYTEITGVSTNKNTFDYFTRDQYSLGLHFTPEKMYNSPDDRPDINIYSLDISLIYQMSKYIFQTGIGYTYYENDHNFNVNYRDFLGTYNDLDSIAFIYNPVSGSVTPNYFWNETSVYDTADQSLTSRVTNYYSSIQLPLLIGYEIFEKNRFSLFVKGGPLVSLLVYKNEPGATYYSTDRKVTSIDYTNPSRTQINWQFQGSIGIAYQITQRFSLAVEPTIKYYFNNVYGRNKSAVTRPYLFGISTGIIYTIK